MTHPMGPPRPAGPRPRLPFHPLRPGSWPALHGGVVQSRKNLFRRRPPPQPGWTPLRNTPLTLSSGSWKTAPRAKWSSGATVARASPTAMSWLACVTITSRGSRPRWAVSFAARCGARGSPSPEEGTCLRGRRTPHPPAPAPAWRCANRPLSALAALPHWSPWWMARGCGAGELGEGGGDHGPGWMVQCRAGSTPSGRAHGSGWMVRCRA